MSSRCPLCLSDDTSPVASVKEYLFRSKDYEYVRCKSCAHCFLSPVPGDAALEDFYSRAVPELRRLYPIPEDFTAEDLEKARPELEKIEFLASRGLLPSSGKILDVGFGAGGFLVSMRRKGWECHGIEFTDKVSLLPGVEQYFTPHFGPDGFDRFDDADFDLVSLWHVLEHVADPVAILQKVRRVVKSEGRVVVAVPSLEGLSGRLFGSHWGGLLPPWHIQQFTPRGLTRVGAEAGFLTEEIVGFGVEERRLLWLESFGALIEESRDHSRSRITTFLLRLGRKAASILFPVILRVEERVGRPSAVVALYRKNPLT